MHCGVLGYIVGYWDAWWGLLSCIVGECPVKLCGFGLHGGGIMGYMVECWATWWGLFGSIMGSVSLYSGVLGVECWGTGQ